MWVGLRKTEDLIELIMVKEKADIFKEFEGFYSRFHLTSKYVSEFDLLIHRNQLMILFKVFFYVHHNLKAIYIFKLRIY